MSFDKLVAAKRRLALLELLFKMGGEARADILETCLKSAGFRGVQYGEGVRSDLRFLEGHGLVELSWDTTAWREEALSGVLTKRGVAYLAREVPQIDGVERPAIGL